MKKRDYEIGKVFQLGQGLFQVQEADDRYFFKGESCSDCTFQITRKACNILACKKEERKDGKEVVFEMI